MASPVRYLRFFIGKERGLYHYSGHLNLDQELLKVFLQALTLRCLRIRSKDDLFAESSSNGVARVAEFDMTAYRHQDRYVCFAEARKILDVVGDIVWIDDLTIVGLHFVMDHWYVFLKHLLKFHSV